MWTQGLFVSLLVVVVRSQIDEIANLFDDIFSEVDGDLVFGPDLRGLAEISRVQAFMSRIKSGGNIRNYGCHCKFDQSDTTNRMLPGSGAPVDPYDAACRRLRLGYQCASIDNDSCDPNARVYEVDAQDFFTGMRRTTSGMFHNFTTNCVMYNHHDICAMHTCISDLQFIQTMYKLTRWDRVTMDYVNIPVACGNVVDPANGSTGGGSGSGPRSDDSTECCGIYPDRTPFNSNKSQCCANIATYNVAVSQCCDDGSLTAIGNECS